MTRLLAVLALGVIGLGCRTEFPVEYEIPEPTISTPYGLLAVDVEVGDTRDAKLILSSPGFVDRTMDLSGDGVLVMRVNRGPWALQVKGSPAPRKVVTFGDEGGQQKVTGGGTRAWPDTPIVVDVRRSFMTNAGRICAHSGCKDTWTGNDHPAFDAWMAQERLIVAAPAATEPEPPSEAPKPVEPGADP